MQIILGSGQLQTRPALHMAHKAFYCGAQKFYPRNGESSSLQGFYKCLNKESFKNSLTLAKQMFSLSGSTYTYMQINVLANELQQKQTTFLFY